MAANDYSIDGQGDFCPVANLAQPVSYFDTRFSLRNLIADSPEDIYVGMAAMIDEEIVVVTNVGAGYVDVLRGCSDTIPWPHGQDAVIWFYADEIGGDLREYVAGEQVTTKPLPWLNSGPRLPIDESPPLELTMNWRFSRPYAPGLMQQNGNPWFQPSTLTAANSTLTLTWTHRDRVLQADRQIDHFQDSIGPEPGTTYLARIYNHLDELVRTEMGLTGTSWIYHWDQAVTDFGIGTAPAGSLNHVAVSGRMEFASYRDDLESWQFYTLPFNVDNAAPFVQVTSLAETAMQPYVESDGTDGGGIAAGMLTTQVATTQVQTDEELASDRSTAGGVFVTHMAQRTSQPTSFYTPMSRVLFEAPYTHLIRQLGSVPANGRVVTSVARPSDRLTDSHKIFSVERAHQGAAQLPFEYKTSPPFTPWVTLADNLDYLTNTVRMDTSSLYDGVSLEGVKPGQLALVGAEVVTVISIAGDLLTVARGCADTIPARHGAGARVWFFEAGAGLDPTNWPIPGDVNLLYKMVPDVFGPPLDLNTVPTDTLEMKTRNQRPFPPGQVMVNGKHWFQGAISSPERSTVITWVPRNRVTQGKASVDHTAPGIAHEDGTRYRIQIRVRIYRPNAQKPLDVVVREEWITGYRFEYTYDMAMADGTRIARLMSTSRRLVCGSVSVPITLDAVRGDLENWQGYSIMVSLPAQPCPVRPGQPSPGGPGGQGPSPGNGNGNVGGGGDGYDPGDGSGGGSSPGSDGGGPRPPDPLPPDWPDPVEPPPQPDPTDPIDPPQEPPEGIGYWDYRWDTFWASKGQTYNPGDGYDPGES